jgi:hypothetical protein
MDEGPNLDENEEPERDCTEFCHPDGKNVVWGPSLEDEWRCFNGDTYPDSDNVAEVVAEETVGWVCPSSMLTSLFPLPDVVQWESVQVSHHFHMSQFRIVLVALDRSYVYLGHSQFHKGCG